MDDDSTIYEPSYIEYTRHKWFGIKMLTVIITTFIIFMITMYTIIYFVSKNRH